MMQDEKTKTIAEAYKTMKEAIEIVAPTKSKASSTMKKDDGDEDDYRDGDEDCEGNTKDLKVKQKGKKVVNELSKKTLGNYSKSATYDLVSRSIALGSASRGDSEKEKADAKRFANKIPKRYKGINKVTDRLTKEAFDKVKPEMKTKDLGYVNIGGARVKDTPEDRLKHHQKTFPNAKTLPKANEELTGGQKKIDKNKNGKLDAQDFKMLRKEDTVNELSKKTLGSYIKKASDSSAYDANMQGYKSGLNHSKFNNSEVGKVEKKRSSGISKAIGRLTQEDTEQLDELSKDTLKSYIKKGTRSANSLSKRADKSYDKSRYAFAPSSIDKHAENSAKYDADSNKRRVGVDKAKGRLTQEDTEQLDELSKKTLVSFIKARDNDSTKINDYDKRNKRNKGVQTAINKYLQKDKNKAMMTKEDTEQYDHVEESLSGPQDREWIEKMERHERLHAYHKRMGNHDEAAKHKAEVTKLERHKEESNMKEWTNEYQWNWDAISEASENEIDDLIEQMNDEEYESFVAEFDELQEGNNMYQASTNSRQPMDANGREKLKPRAQADAAFYDEHERNKTVVDYPGKVKPTNKVQRQAKVRGGENRNPEPMKTLSDFRKGV
jgi:hypothetical protein